jgi:alpha-tubulin suppressor-like RCC1 family protein
LRGLVWGKLRGEKVAMRPRRFGIWLLVVAFALTLLPLLGQHWFLQAGQASEEIATLGGGWAWGDDGSTQLGNGAPNDGGSSAIPVQSAGLLGNGNLTNITAVAGGSTHSLALRSNGTVVAWGNDTFGQLGNGAATDNGTSNAPVEVSNLTNVVAIGAGGQHSIALRRDGTVWTWGNDGSGQLGMGGGPPNDCDPGAGTRLCANTPVQVLGIGGSGLLTNVIAIAAGNAHNLALRSDGTVVAWGDDLQEQLGNGAANDNGTSNVAVTVCASGSGALCPPLTTSSVSPPEDFTASP